MANHTRCGGGVALRRGLYTFCREGWMSSRGRAKERLLEKKGLRRDKRVVSA